jgi:PTS system nitrogen regulatory IIA component
MELLTTDEAARFLRISPHTVRSWVFYKKIPIARIGRRIRFRREDLERFVNGRLENIEEGVQSECNG